MTRHPRVCVARETGESDVKERWAGRRKLASVCDMKICMTGALGEFSQEFLASSGCSQAEDEVTWLSDLAGSVLSGEREETYTEEPEVRKS